MVDRPGVVEATLGDGSVILVEVVGGHETDVARRSPLDFSEISAQLESLARAVGGPFASLNPTRAAVEFGCSVGVESGKLTALLVNGVANASIKVTLEWTSPT